MILKVNSIKLQEKFDKIWTTNWNLEGYELKGEFTSFQSSEQFIFGKFEGSMEMKTIQRKKETEFDYFTFSHIKKHHKQVLEVDKLSILPEARNGDILSLMLNVMYQYSNEKNIKYLVAQIKPMLFFLLKRKYKISIHEFIEGYEYVYKGDKVKPVYIDIKECLENREKYPFLLPDKEYEKMMNDTLIF